MKRFYAVIWQRTEYGKRVRKAYESGLLLEKRNNMRKRWIRDDEISNTITTVQKDFYVLEVEDEDIGVI